MNTNPAKQFLELNRPRERREPDADFSRLLKVNGPNDLGQEASAQDFKKHLEELESKFRDELKKVKDMPEKPEEFKSHNLPLARIKKIMKSDEDVKMISAEAPILFAKACELFITDVTFRALFYTNFHKRKTLQKSDISTTVSSHEMFDFLIDVLPREDNDKDFIGKREPERSRGDNMFKMITKNSYTLDHNPALMRNPLSAQAPLRSQFPRIPEISDPHDFDRELDTRSLVASSLLPFTKK